MLLLIDNYDSFSYNLFQLVGGMNPDIQVVRNDAVTTEEVERLSPTHIILSPGPGRPGDAGVCEEVVRRFAGKVPILGVCLGHQAICEVYGAKIVRAECLVHGKKSTISIDQGCEIFKGLPDKIDAARYHSLVAASDTMPQDLCVTAVDAGGEIMAVSHRNMPVYGVQFHPESILTPAGNIILKNFLDI